ncbi:MAG: recombinase RecA [Phycisphaerales bacterium]|jgi:recombination protein RecA
MAAQTEMKDRARTPETNGDTKHEAKPGMKPERPVEVKAPEKTDMKNDKAAGPAAPAANGAPTLTKAQQAALAEQKAKDEAADKSKRKALEVTVAQIEKTFGKGSIMRMDEDAYLAIQGISTGALSLDLALGGRGIPRGRIVEIFGPESSGKTTLALTIAANAQKEGGVAAVIDAEHALDPSWARKLGVNIDNLLVSQPDTGEQALEICELLVRSNAVDIIVVDSVAALVPRAEIEGEMGDASMGLQARLMSQAMRKLTGVIARSNCTVIFINQIREKIGVMFGSPETTTGGRALKFYSSVRIDIRRTGAIKEGDVTVGSRTRARVVKNKIAPPFRDAEFDIMYTEGISIAGDLLDLAVGCEVVQKSGAWFSYGEIRIGQGREVSKQFLKDNQELMKEIRAKVLALKMAAPIKAGTPAADDDTDPGEE